MLWLAYAFLAIIFATLFALLARILGIRSACPRAYTVIFEVSSALFSLVLIIIEPISFRPVSILILGLTLVSTICYAASDRLLFLVNKSFEASSLSIIDKLIPVVGFLASALFLEEGVTLKKAIAVLLIVGGNLMVAYKNATIKLNKNFALALLATVCFGLALTIDKKTSASYSLPVYSFITFLVPAFYNTFLPPLPLKMLVKEFKNASRSLFLLSAMSVLSYFFTLKAFETAEASKVIPIVSASTMLIVLSSAIILNERSHLSKKIIAGISVGIGVFLLSQ